MRLVPHRRLVSADRGDLGAGSVFKGFSWFYHHFLNLIFYLNLFTWTGFVFHVDSVFVGRLLNLTLMLFFWTLMLFFSRCSRPKWRRYDSASPILRHQPQLDQGSLALLRSARPSDLHSTCRAVSVHSFSSFHFNQVFTMSAILDLVYTLTCALRIKLIDVTFSGYYRIG